jgi:hypothetical protein
MLHLHTYTPCVCVCVVCGYTVCMHVFYACIHGCEVELARIFSLLDCLRDLLAETLDGWQHPSIAVVGEESSGKSRASHDDTAPAA